MNISVYLNDGEVISSVDINEATVEEALSAIKAFGFGENKEEWLYSDNQKIKYKVEVMDTRRSIGRQLLELEEERDKWKNDYNEAVLYYNGLINKHIEECEEWKEKYKIECQHNDEIKMANDVLVKDFRTLMNDRDYWRDKSNMFEKCYTGADKRYLELQKELEKYKELASDREDLKIALDQANDYVTAVEKTRDQLISDCETLRNELNEYKEIASDRDDLKIENDKVKELCDMLQNEKDELERRFNLVREDYLEEHHQVSELIGENDNLKKENEKLKIENDRVKTALVSAKTTCATLEQDKFFWKNRWESEFKDCIMLKKELEECQEKKSES